MLHREIDFLPFFPKKGARLMIFQELTGDLNNQVTVKSFGTFKGRVTLNIFLV